MIKPDKKILAHYEKVKFIISLILGAIFVALVLFGSIGLILFELDIKLAALFCLKWCAIILPAVIVLLLAILFYYSDAVIFKEDSLFYYRCFFSKKSKEISYDKITECIISDGLRKHAGEYIRGRKIYLYNKNNLLAKYDIYSSLMYMCILKLGERKVRVVDNNLRLKTLSSQYNVNLEELSSEQKWRICKHYCKLMKSETLKKL